MQSSTGSPRGLTGLVTLAALAAGLASCHHTTIVHPEPSFIEGVTVVGIGKASGAPDIAKANVGVETRAGTVEQASSVTRTKMEAMLAAFAQLGIARKDLRTHSYVVQYEQYPQPYPPPPMPAPERGTTKGGSATTSEAARPSGEYRVQNMVEVTVRQIDRVGAVLAAATDAGANVMWGVEFELGDPAPLEAEARQKAVADAKARAADLAKHTGVELGPIISVTEVMAGGPVLMAKTMGDMRAEMAQAASIPIEKGEVLVERGVQLVYARAKK